MDGELLKYYITHTGHTIPEVAKAIGMSPSGLYRRIKGECAFTIEKAADIQRVLQLDITQFLSIFFPHLITQNAILGNE